jgi:DNA-binding NarL/FixJ family response regulator
MVARILIAYPRELGREGLARTLTDRTEFRIVGRCSTGQEAIKRAGRIKPDIIILSSEISECGCIEVIEEVKQLSPKTHIIILSIFQDGKELLLALKAGARAYLGNRTSVHEIISAIRHVQTGGVVISANFVDKLVASGLESDADNIYKPSVIDYGLSDREIDTIRLLANGASNEEIARTLFISKHTVKIHLSHIMNKMHVHSRQRAALLAIQSGVVTNEPETEVLINS